MSPKSGEKSKCVIDVVMEKQVTDLNLHRMYKLSFLYWKFSKN